MLSGDQIDYLLQIEDTKPTLPERTVRVMLGALRWSPEEIEHGIKFLNRPPATEEPKLFVKPSVEVQNPVPLLPKPEKPIVIKQNPFPLGSPLFKNTKRRSELLKKKGNHFIRGVIMGGMVFIAGLFAYGYFLNNAGV